MNIRFLPVACLVAAGIFAFAGTPAKAEFDGIYLGGAAGLAMPNDSDVEGGGIDVDADLENTPALSAFVGNKYENNWRAEMELGWRDPDIDTVGGVNGSGDVGVTHLMFNALYDFDVDLDPGIGTPIKPYLGAGIGPALVHVDGGSPINGSTVDDRELTLAAQGIAGLNFLVSDRLTVFTDYRYFQTTDFDIRTAAGTRHETDYSDHRIMIGFRWSFGGPPPAPEPMPAKTEPAPMPEPKPEPAPEPEPIARNFIVFFDWDEATIREDARQILDAAADNARTGGVSRIELEGHADRSGTVPYNDKLSQRRADAVAAYLQQLGLAKQNMAVTWKGETEPLVPTDDGVREPQNRRVEIVFP